MFAGNGILFITNAIARKKTFVTTNEKSHGQLSSKDSTCEDI